MGKKRTQTQKSSTASAADGPAPQHEGITQHAIDLDTRDDPAISVEDAGSTQSRDPLLDSSTAYGETSPQNAPNISFGSGDDQIAVTIVPPSAVKFGNEKIKYFHEVIDYHLVDLKVPPSPAPSLLPLNEPDGSDAESTHSIDSFSALSDLGIPDAKEIRAFLTKMQHKSAAANRAAKSNNNHNSKYMSCITSFIIHAFARYPPHFAAVNDPKAAPPHEHANALTIIGLMLTALALFMMEVCGIEPRYLGFTDKHRIPTGRKVLYQVIATIPCTLQYFGHLLALSGAMLFYWNLWSVVLLGWLLLFCILYMLCCALGIHNKWQSAAKEIDDWLKKSR